LVQQFLLGERSLNLEEVFKWIPPLSLIDWSGWEADLDGSSHRPDQSYLVPEGTAMLHAFVRPLFHCDRHHDLMLENGRPLFRADQLPKAGLLRRLFQLFRFGSLDEAILVLRDRYLALGHSIVMPPRELEADGERIAAALLIPMTCRDVAAGLRRWLQPAKGY
jgi:CRISPR-associated protein Csx17